MNKLRSISGAILQSKVSISSTATLITSSLANSRTRLLHNNGSVTIYLGDATVTTTDGYLLAAGEEKAFDIESGVAMYGIVETGTCELRILEGA